MSSRPEMRCRGPAGAPPPPPPARHCVKQHVGLGVGEDGAAPVAESADRRRSRLRCLARAVRRPRRAALALDNPRTGGAAPILADAKGPTCCFTAMPSGAVVEVGAPAGPRTGDLGLDDIRALPSAQSGVPPRASPRGPWPTISTAADEGALPIRRAQDRQSACRSSSDTRGMPARPRPARETPGMPPGPAPRRPRAVGDAARRSPEHSGRWTPSTTSPMPARTPSLLMARPRSRPGT